MPKRSSAILSRLIVSATLAAAVLAGCGGDDQPARTTASAAETFDPDEAGSPNQIDLEPPPGLEGQAREQWMLGKTTAAQSGCLACHTIATAGNHGPGPRLTRVGSRLSAEQIAATLRDPTAPMPSFASFERRDPAKFNALVAFVASLR